jgi:hypothetical protein
MTRAKAQKPPITKISKHEIQNSKQFEMTKIAKIPNKSRSDSMYRIFPIEAYLSVSWLRISIFDFGFVLLASWRDTFS